MKTCTKCGHADRKLILKNDKLPEIRTLTYECRVCGCQDCDLGDPPCRHPRVTKKLNEEEAEIDIFCADCGIYLGCE